MGFCTECGSELAENALFCIECGNKVLQQKDELNAEVADESESVGVSTEELAVKAEVVDKSAAKTSAHVASEEQAAAEDKDTKTLGKEPAVQQSASEQEDPRIKQIKSSPWKKILIGIIVIIILALFGVHKWLESYFDPMNDLVAMDEAVTNKDLKGFMSYIEFDEKALLDEDSYFELIEESEWKEVIRGQYFEIIEAIKESGNVLNNEILDRYNGLLYTVERKDILFGLYHQVSLVAVPFDLKANSNLSKTEVTIHDETFALEEDEEGIFAKAYPGEYNVEAKSKQKYATFEFEELMTVESSAYNVIDIEFESLTFDVYASYGYEDAIVFIDGESTEKKISELDELGPFSADSNMSIYAILKDKGDYDIMSNIINSKDETSSSLHFSFNDKNKVASDKLDDQEVGQFILQFRDAYENAVNYVDYEYIKDFVKKDSAADKELKKFVKDMEDGYYHYEFTENTVLSAKEKDDNKYEVKTNEKFEFRDEDFKWYDYDREKLYHVERNEDQLQVTKIEYKDTKKDRQ